MNQGCHPTEEIKNPLPPKGRPAYMPNQIDEPKWHTGKPTEEGLYRVVFKYADTVNIYETICNYAYGKFTTHYLKSEISLGIILAWQKIEPYKPATEHSSTTEKATD